MWFARDCFAAGPCCTPQIREELSQLSFQTIYSITKKCMNAEVFWYFSEKIVEMLEKQVSRDYLNYSESVINGQ